MDCLKNGKAFLVKNNATLAISRVTRIIEIISMTSLLCDGNSLLKNVIIV